MNRISGNIAFLVLSASSAASSLADEAVAAATQTAAKTLQPLSYGSALNVIGSLIVVLGVLFAAAWVMRRGQGFMKPKASQIQIVSHLAVGVKEKVLLLKIGEENILLGCSSGNMRSLHTWQGDIPDLPKDDSSSGGDKFFTVLQQQLRPQNLKQSDHSNDQGPTQ
jgi:flagellar protein FliO/FliZ